MIPDAAGLTMMNLRGPSASEFLLRDAAYDLREVILVPPPLPAPPGPGPAPTPHPRCRVFPSVGKYPVNPMVRIATGTGNIRPPLGEWDTVMGRAQKWNGIVTKK
jgi:hypothetical protein